ncbi:MAG: hypothetical protein HON90_10835, partial [Halobacteriovoraceae bacterium]|nr:hypothetical protein [Halobacteriovoraceae bacterium]
MKSILIIYILLGSFLLYTKTFAGITKPADKLALKKRAMEEFVIPRRLGYGYINSTSEAEAHSFIEVACKTNQALGDFDCLKMGGVLEGIFRNVKDAMLGSSNKKIMDTSVDLSLTLLSRISLYEYIYMNKRILGYPVSDDLKGQCLKNSHIYKTSEDRIDHVSLIKEIDEEKVKTSDFKEMRDIQDIATLIKYSTIRKNLTAEKIIAMKYLLMFYRGETRQYCKSKLKSDLCRTLNDGANLILESYPILD